MFDILPSYQLTKGRDLGKLKSDSDYFLIVIDCKISIVSGRSSSAADLIPSRQIYEYSLLLQWFCSREMRCHQHRIIMTS